MGYGALELAKSLHGSRSLPRLWIQHLKQPADFSVHAPLTPTADDLPAPIKVTYHSGFCNEKSQ